MPPGAPARRLRTGRTDLAQALGHDWQNAYAQLVTGLKRDLSRIEDDRQREEAIAAMRKVLDSYGEFRARKRSKAAHRK